MAYEKIGKADRDFLLLSLALCSLARPGFHYAAGEIAEKLRGRAEFERFRELNADQTATHEEILFWKKQR
jgi:hypothetical protein